jgi:DNA-binding transcriptional LysR family regulator
MTDRFEAMSILVAAVEGGSLSAAGRRLGLPLPTVSRRLSDLEARLGSRLVVRTSRSLTLTDAGELYVSAARRILEDVAEAERAASGEFQAPRGDLVITAPIAFGRLHVLPIAIEFLRRYPEIDLRLLLSDRIANLVEEHVDLAVRIGDLPDSGLIATGVGMVRQVVCASPAYLAAHGTPMQPSDLAQHAGITFEPQRWTLGKIHARLTVNTAEAAIDAAVAGVGLARVLSYQAAVALARGELTIVLRDFEPAPRSISLVFAGRRLVPQKLRAFLDFATPRLRAALPQPGAIEDASGVKEKPGSRKRLPGRRSARASRA